MAITSGHGNPKWTREEVILALDLYFDCKGKPPSASDHRVQTLSEILRAFPHHNQAARKASFRNADGVAFKLQNLRKVATGKGLGNVSQTDRDVWEEFGSNPSRTKELAQLIKSGILVLNEIREELADYEVFPEGRVVTETHLRRERSAKLRARLIQNRRSIGRLFCEICKSEAPAGRSDIGEAIFEAHHILPLSTGSERSTKLSEMALLCACCHRMIHRAITIKGSWISIEDARLLFLNPDSVQ